MFKRNHKIRKHAGRWNKKQGVSVCSKVLSGTLALTLATFAYGSLPLGSVNAWATEATGQTEVLAAQGIEDATLVTQSSDAATNNEIAAANTTTEPIQQQTVNAEPASTVSASSRPDSSYVGFYTDLDGVRRWYENGIIAADKAFYDPNTDAWYWADADGSIATNKDVYIPVSNEDRSQGKWVRFDENSHMIKGEDYRYDAWYYFDEITGEMAKGFKDLWTDGQGKWVCYDRITGQMYHGQANDLGNWYYFDDYTGATQYGFRYIPEDNKWVFYDRITGIMQYGEQYIDEGWYYLTPVTGAVDYGFSYIPTANKWVYYDLVTGRMIYGQQRIDGKLYYFDECTGRQYSGNDIRNKLIGTVQSTYGANLDCIGELRNAGGSVCYEGPCMSYVWWCFWHAGLNQFLCDGAISGWPHDNSNWYAARGRYDMAPMVGDIAFFRYSGWADAIGASTSHAGIVIAVSGGSVLVADALDSGIWPRWYSIGQCVGFAHPYYD